MENKTDNRVKEQAVAQYENIKRMVENVKNAKTEEGRAEAEQVIQEDPLSIQIRSGWFTPGESAEPEEFEILLCTGGPAVRIIGQLNQYGEPESANLQYQDWFTKWETCVVEMENDILIEYCRNFYFGE